MSGALFVLWIGMLQTQAIDIERFDTMAECEAAAQELEAEHSILDAECIPYEVAAE